MIRVIVPRLTNFKLLTLPKNTSIVYVCSNCEAQFTKWIGRCLECGKWGTLQETMADRAKKPGAVPQYPSVDMRGLHDEGAKDVTRTVTGIDELDRVLGGGIVPGSLILLGGEPGIGKSTLALQLSLLISKSVYISGEESVDQIQLRARRITAKQSPGLKLANTTNVDRIITTLEKEKPTLAIIDSIQTISSDEVEGEPGNITQIRACTTKLLDAAKRTNIAILLVGHVTKDGVMAGPRTLEHLVDTVLYFEGERHHNLRILRAVKNRFGSTNEVGMFDMTETGLIEVKNPSAVLLAERGDNMPGSIVTCLIEGTRPLLVEIQALVNKTTFGYPIRKASGFDINRLHVLIAVLQKRAGLNLAQYDIHINVVGGIEATEPGADLAVCLAIASAYKDKAAGADLAVFGEIGLGGEVRSVRHLEKRIHECEQLGMKRIIIPHSAKPVKTGKIKLITVRNIQELITHT